jgi:hypothetical protein
MNWLIDYDIEGDYGRWHSDCGRYMIQRFWYRDGCWLNNPYHVLYHDNKTVIKFADLEEAKVHAERHAKEYLNTLDNRIGTNIDTHA